MKIVEYLVEILVNIEFDEYFDKPCFENIFREFPRNPRINQ